MNEDRSGKSGEVLFEFRQLGAQMRVAAIDAETGTEVVVIAPATRDPAPDADAGAGQAPRRSWPKGRAAAAATAGSAASSRGKYA